MEGDGSSLILSLFIGFVSYWFVPSAFLHVLEAKEVKEKKSFVFSEIFDKEKIV